METFFLAAEEGFWFRIKGVCNELLQNTSGPFATQHSHIEGSRN